MAGGGKEGSNDVLVLLKALKILEILAAEKKIGLSQVTQRSKVSKPAAFRILSTLERHGYVERVEETRQYRPGPQLIRLSLLFSAGVDIATIAEPYMRDLHARYGETVNLGVLSGAKILYVDIIEGSHGLRTSAEVGSLHDLHSTALGLAVLSRLPAKQVRSLLDEGRLERLTPKTLAYMSDLLAELETTRKRGYSIDDEFTEIGARCVAAAVRVNDHGAFAAISLSGPASRMKDDVINEIGGELKRIAADMEVLLGRPDARPV